MIALSCGVNISAVNHLFLSQSTLMTDRQTDRRTNGQTELRQQYRALHYRQPHGKNYYAEGNILLSCEITFSEITPANRNRIQIATKFYRETSARVARSLAKSWRPLPNGCKMAAKSKKPTFRHQNNASFYPLPGGDFGEILTDS